MDVLDEALLSREPVEGLIGVTLLADVAAESESGVGV
jgi:hypothetical protein